MQAQALQAKKYSDFSSPNYQQISVPFEMGFGSTVISPADATLWRKQNQQHALGNLTAQSQQVQQGATQVSPSSGGTQIQLAPGQQLTPSNGNLSSPTGGGSGGDIEIGSGGIMGGSGPGSYQ